MAGLARYRAAITTAIECLKSVGRLRFVAFLLIPLLLSYWLVPEDMAGMLLAGLALLGGVHAHPPHWPEWPGQYGGGAAASSDLTIVTHNDLYGSYGLPTEHGDKTDR